MDAVNIDHLTKRFGSVTALDELSLSIEQGEIFGLVGPDGAGKTTLMRLMASILDPTSGTVRVLGHDSVRQADAVHDEIAYMSQRFGLYPDLTVMENIHFYADLYGVGASERDQRLQRLLAFSNMAPFRRRRAGNLSGGMKQKLGLVCALIHSPKVLLLDEPTNGVDPVSRRDFWRILYQLLKEGVTIVVSTAYLDEAERCSRVALLHGGKIVACDTPARVKELLPGVILEVRTRSARRAAAILKGILGEGSVALFGDRVHVVTPTPHETAVRIRELLAVDTITPDDIQLIPPSLEDVFVALLGEGAIPHELHA